MYKLALALRCTTIQENNAAALASYTNDLRRAPRASKVRVKTDRIGGDDN